MTHPTTPYAAEPDPFRWFWTAHLSLTRRHRIAVQWSLRRYWTWGGDWSRWNHGLRCPWVSVMAVHLPASPTLRRAFVQRGVPRWHRAPASDRQGGAS